MSYRQGIPPWRMSRYGSVTVRLRSSEQIVDSFRGRKFRCRCVGIMISSFIQPPRPETGVATALDFMLGLDGETPIVGLVGSLGILLGVTRSAGGRGKQCFNFKCLVWCLFFVLCLEIVVRLFQFQCHLQFVYRAAYRLAWLPRVSCWIWVNHLYLLWPLDLTYNSDASLSPRPSPRLEAFFQYLG